MVESIGDWRMSCIVSLWIFLALFILRSLASAARAPASRLHSPGREVIVAMAWILATFLLSSNLLQYVGFVVADRVLYLPSYGFGLIAVHVLHALFSRCQLYLEKRKKSGGGNSTGKAGAEKKDVEDLKREIRDLKRNHYSELQKIENVHAEKYRQLKQLVDQYRIQISGLEKV